jgi:L-ascorbate metabolism protein UlaG (beta-lactamase superfamily)
MDVVLFRWLGVAGFELTAFCQTLIVDPYLTRIPLQRLWFGRVRPNAALVQRTLPRCDQILVTHAHFDHLLDAPALAITTGARVCGTPNVCALLRAAGLPAEQVRALSPGETISTGAYAVRVWPGQHPAVPGYGPRRLPTQVRPPRRPRDYRMDGVLAYEITVGGLTLLTEPGGDADSLPRTDVLLASPFTPLERLAPILTRVRPRLVIPLHWDNLFRPLAPHPRPYFHPPQWAWPPLRRVDLEVWRAGVMEAWPEAWVLVPEPLRVYALAPDGTATPWPGDPVP